MAVAAAAAAAAVAAQLALARGAHRRTRGAGSSRRRSQSAPPEGGGAARGAWEPEGAGGAPARRPGRQVCAPQGRSALGCCAPSPGAAPLKFSPAPHSDLILAPNPGDQSPTETGLPPGRRRAGKRHSYSDRHWRSSDSHMNRQRSTNRHPQECIHSAMYTTDTLRLLHTQRDSPRLTHS